MAITGSKMQRFILRSVVPIICTITIGFLFSQEYAFNRQSGAFQFVWSGIVASLFYYLLMYVKPRDALLGLILLLFLTFVTTQSTRAAFVLRDIFYVAGIGTSIYIYFMYFKRHAADNYAYPPFVLAGIYAVCYIVISEIHLLIVRNFFEDNIYASFVGLASSSAYFGTLIGFGVGTGITLNEKFFEDK